MLKQLVSEFEIVPSLIPEEALEDPWDTAKSLATAKAAAVWESTRDALVIGADTVVAYETERGRFVQLAKPESADDAAAMLEQLSGRTHLVITGLAVVAANFREVVAGTTRVRFRPLKRREIEKYVETGEPMDKAGAYAIQGGAQQFVESVDGSVSNVIGLPIEVLGPILHRAMSSRE